MFSFDNENHRLRLHCDLTIFQAGQLWSALSEALEHEAVAEIDLAEVGELDSAGVQLLLMLKRMTASWGRELRLVNHSSAVIEVLGLVDVERLLGDPVILASPNRSADL